MFQGPSGQQSRVDTGRVLVHDGSLYYETAGSGPAVVLLHSGNFDSRTWDRQFLALAHTHHVVRYDARGLGRSSPANVPYAARDDLLALLDSLHIGRASLAACPAVPASLSISRSRILAGSIASCSRRQD
jgi:3-oxoadipate enol-lactonase